MTDERRDRRRTADGRADDAVQSDPRVEEIMARFVESGGRRTAARQAIVEAIVDAGGHVTVEDVAATVHERFPSVNLSTVYRTLETLEALDVVDHVHLGHGRAVFHLTEHGHQHLYCESCGRVESLAGEKLGPFRDMLEREHGFVLDNRHFALVGRCRRCVVANRSQ